MKIVSELNFITTFTLIVCTGFHDKLAKNMLGMLARSRAMGQSFCPVVLLLTEELRDQQKR